MCGNAALCSTRLAVFLEMAPPEGMTSSPIRAGSETRCMGPGHMAEILLPDFDLPVASGGRGPGPASRASTWGRWACRTW